ncbi:MAG: hypothetical protein IPP99_05360 [Chitinophagaceae bacterium]|nr:hypothetical protein [Chitinophagaceae bacterium]
MPDSTGLFIDMTAGYDIVTNNIFWEFQAIDPITLLPPEDPLAGFVFVQDTLNPEYGHGFVNFTIKPRQDAQTLDTIGARAFIVFDQNDTIPTNIHKNTIDAVAPVSQINTITSISTNPITLSWTGADDANGSGIDYYTVYVSNRPAELQCVVSANTQNGYHIQFTTRFELLFLCAGNGPGWKYRTIAARCYPVLFNWQCLTGYPALF